MPRGKRRRGKRRRRVEITLSGEVVADRPTRQPRRVKRSCEGESVALRSEYGEPRTSKEASRHY